MFEEYNYIKNEIKNERHLIVPIYKKKLKLL